MSLLSALELVELVKRGVIEGVELKDINAASIDLHLGGDFLFESVNEEPEYVDLSLRQRPGMDKSSGFINLFPGQFCLAATSEIFHLPNDISGQFILKSSMARAGLEHSQAGWADAGWHGSALTLELTNLLRHNVLVLKSGMAIGQMIFYRHEPVPPEFLYSTKGRYNNDATVQGLK